MRIVGGRYRGKRLHSPVDASIRPTSDRARESLFNILDHQGLVAGSAFLDLFCGTGAVGLEAFSRGADQVWLMDKDIGLAATNLKAFDKPPAVRVVNQQVLRNNRPALQFDVAFLDPPYGQALAGTALASLRRGWLKPSSWVVVELEAKEPLAMPDGFFIRQERRYGRAKMVFLGLDPAGEDGPV